MTNNQHQRGILSYTIFTLAVVVALLLGYVGYRLATAEYVFSQSLREAAANRGNTTYQFMSEAIRLHPFEDRYRIAYSQINLALANSIAGKEEITERDRGDIQQLVTQAIREARNAVALNPLQASHWANLANTYRNLINVATGADGWALRSFEQAILLDQNNPQLRVAYGQLLFTLQQYELAARQFEIAASLKSDFANAYFNLAAAYREQEKLQQAKRAYEITLNLVPTDTQDYTTVKAELKKVEETIAKRGQQQEATTEEVPAPAQTRGTTAPTPGLQAPEAASPAAVLEPPLELSEEEFGPQISPQVTPTTTPLPSPNGKNTPLSPTP